MTTSMPTGVLFPVADRKVIKFEIIGDNLLSLSAVISWRGKPTFEAAITNTITNVTHATECNRYGIAKRAYNTYKRNLG